MANLDLEHGAEGPGAEGGRGGPEPDHGATGAGTVAGQTKPANPDPERPSRRRGRCNSHLDQFSYVSQQLGEENTWIENSKTKNWKEFLILVMTQVCQEKFPMDM